MNEAQLQGDRAAFMDSLYEHSGRSNGLYTGLYEEWRVSQMSWPSRILYKIRRRLRR
jgi:hypothetical protein